MTQALLAAAATGRVRVSIVRAADFFGPGVTESSLGAQVFGRGAGVEHTVVLGLAVQLRLRSMQPGAWAVIEEEVRQSTS